MSEIVVSGQISDLLQANLLEARDLIEAIGISDVEELADQPGLYACRCVVPVRRPFDPETAEMRRLEVRLRRHESSESWEVESIVGLVDPNEALSAGDD